MTHQRDIALSQHAPQEQPFFHLLYGARSILRFCQWIYIGTQAGQHCLVVGAVICGCATTNASPTRTETAPPPVAEQRTDARGSLDDLVADLCEKRVVLLGESDHGDARTWEMKTMVVRRLVESCQFDVLAFESGIYDFLALEDAYEAGTAVRQDVANAMGGLWGGARAIQPLISFAHEATVEGRLELVGLDDQIGDIMSTFSTHKLPGRLAVALPVSRQEDCESRLSHHFQWSYDDSYPYNEENYSAFLACLEAIEDEVTKAETSNIPSEDLIMAINLFQVQTRIDRASTFPRDGSDGMRFFSNGRDRAMFENFQLHQRRRGDQAKTIVWTANVHAAKNLAATGERVSWLTPLGQYIHQHYGEQSAAIAFTAWSGASQPRGRPRIELPIAPTDSLEGQALKPGEELRYLDTDALRELGAIEARPLAHKFTRGPWYEVFDGIVVLREEVPAQHDVVPDTGKEEAR